DVGERIFEPAAAGLVNLGELTGGGEHSPSTKVQLLSSGQVLFRQQIDGVLREAAQEARDLCAAGDAEERVAEDRLELLRVLDVGDLDAGRARGELFVQVRSLAVEDEAESAKRCLELAVLHAGEVAGGGDLGELRADRGWERVRVLDEEGA